jgi:hypothetical protein
MPPAEGRGHAVRLMFVSRFLSATSYQHWKPNALYGNVKTASVEGCAAKRGNVPTQRSEMGQNGLFGSQDPDYSSAYRPTPAFLALLGQSRRQIACAHNRTYVLRSLEYRTLSTGLYWASKP